MNIYSLFQFGRSYRKNARFGPYPHIGSHRFVYYIDRKPLYYFSDRQYTLKDAKDWNTRGLISNLVIAVCTISLLFDNKLDLSDPKMMLVYAAVAVMALLSAIGAVVFMRLRPENDPMLRSFQCISDIEKPAEDTCISCGGKYSRGAHTTCPHCNATIV